MSGWFITTMIFVILTIIAIVTWRLSASKLKQLTAAGSKDEPARDYPYGDKYLHGEKLNDAKNVANFTKITSIVLGIISLMLLAFSSFTVVGVKTIGVVTEFGKPTGTLPNGFHLVAPWASVYEMDAAIQTDSHVRDDNNDATNCTNVRIGNQSVACVDNSVRWRIREDAGDELYQNYKEFDAVRDSLVTRQLTAVLNDVLSTYDPLAAINGASGVTGTTTATAPSLDTLSTTVTDELKKRVGDQIVVESVIIPIIHFDDPTQAKINAYQAEIGNTRIAKQREQTAAAEALANQALSASVSKDPNVLVSKCMDTFAEMVKANQPVPAGLNCWPSANTPGLLVNATPAK